MTHWQRTAAAILPALLLGLVGSVPSQAEAPPADCYAAAKTQLEINQCSAAELRAADAALNTLYQRLQKLYAGEPEFLEKLKVAQRAWIAFRDADIEARFPAQDKRLAYGSMFSMCLGQALTNLTRARTAQLKQWEAGAPEGSVCGGSIRVAD